MGTYLWTCWDWGNGGISPDGVGPRNVANADEGARECSLQGNYVSGCHCGRVSCLSWLQLGLMVARALREDLTQVPLGRVGLWDLVSSSISWNLTVFIVFLVPLEGEGYVVGSLRVP